MVQGQRDGDVGNDSEGEAPIDAMTYTDAASAHDIALHFVENTHQPCQMT